MFAETKFFHKAGEGSGGSDPHNLGYYADLTALQTAYPTGTDGDFAILGSTDTIWVWDSGTSAWKDTDTKGQVTSVNGQTGAVTLTIPAAQVNSDWNASSGVAEILNKPTIPAAIQVSTMPTAAAGELDKIYQFVGTTDANYTNGYFYKCVSDGQDPATYSWTQTDVQPQAGGLPSQTGQSGKFLTTDGTDASWSDKPLVNSTTKSFCLGILGTILNSIGGESTAVGVASVAGQYSTAYGANCSATGEGSVAYGRLTTVTGNYSMAIGQDAHATGVGCIQIGGGTNSTNYSIQFYTTKIFDNISQTIPTDCFAGPNTTPVADGTYVPTLTISSGTATRTWGAAASAPVVPATMPTLAVADWSLNSVSGKYEQAVTVQGITSSNIILVAPAPADAAEWADSVVLCISQTTNSLTFQCDTVPSSALTANVVIIG